MTRKVVSLSVHKNHKARRHAKAMASDIHACVRDAQERFGTDWHGYVFVAWNGEGESDCSWDGTDVLGSCPVNEYAKNRIGRAMGILDARKVLFPDTED